MNDTETQPGILPSVIAGVVAAAVGVGIWALMYTLIDTSGYWLSGPLSGLAIGMAVRMTNTSADRRMQAVAAVLVFFASWLGYATVYATLAKFVDASYQPTFGDGLRDFFRYLNILIFTAVGCYLAYILARRSPSATAPE